MDGEPCPKHPDTRMWLLSTWNQWIYYCPKCDRRYNEQLEPKPDDTPASL